MNKIPILLLTYLLLCTGNIWAQPGEQKGWPSKERHAFITSCIQEAAKGMSEDTARFYCYCMQANVEAAYPTVEEAEKIQDTLFTNPEWQKKINVCLTGFWNSPDRSTFLTECINSSKAGLGVEKAKSYCECMLYKVEVMYPRSADAATALTAEKLASPEWKKYIRSCLDF